MQHEIRQVMENSYLFEGLRPDLIDEIASSATHRMIGAGEILFQKGDSADALWGVLSGRIVIEVGTVDGKEMMLDAFGKGDVFGEVGVLDFGPRRVEARAVQKSELFRLERKHFLKHLQTSPELCFRVFSLLCSHLRETTENLEDTALYKLPNRLAKRLTLLAADSEAGAGAVLHIGQSDLAGMLGVNREAVNRHLRVFEKDGLIALRRQRIEILDQQALSDLASPGQNGDHGGWGIENLAALKFRAFTFNHLHEDTPTPQERHSGGLMAIDAAEYSRSLMADAVGTLKRIEAGLKAVDRAIERYQGHTVWHTGDRVLAEFPDAQLAMQAALAIQEQVNPAKHTGKGKRDSLFHIGVHHGEVLADNHRVFGEAVNIAIRLTELPGSSGICFTGEVRDELEETKNLELQYLGKHELKNIANPVSVFSASRIPWLKRTALWADALVPRRYRPALAVGVMLLAVAAIWLGGERFGVSHAPGPPAQSIAVMSFTLEGDPKNAYLADGLAEEIRSALAAMPETLVIGRQSSDYFEEWKATGQEVGEILRVAYILQGTVGLTGDQLKVSSRLVETGNGTEIWHHNYQGPWQQFNEFQADIVRLANETLAGGATVSQSGVMAPPITDNQEAHKLYLQARALIHEKTKASLVEALSKLERALELEPDFASAHVAMAEIYLHLRFFSGYYKGPWEPGTLAGPHVVKALAIDPNLAEAYVVQGQLLKYSDPAKEESAYRKAISLNPNLAKAQMELGIMLCNQLRSLNDCLPHLENALEIEPLSVEAAYALTMFLQFIPQRKGEALTNISNLKARYPDHPDVNELEAIWPLQEGRPSEAIPLLEKAIARDPDNRTARGYLKIAWFSLGETERALKPPVFNHVWRDVLSPDREESLRQTKKIDVNSWSKGGFAAYVYVMRREWQSAVEVLGAHSQNLDRFRENYEMLLGKSYSPALSLAVAYKALGDDERYREFAELEMEAVDIRWINDGLYNVENSRSMARLYALEGRNHEAMLELERLITTGPNDPRELIHPAFDQMRDLPGFRELKDLQRQRVNEERAKLGLMLIQGG